jgi:succinyl-CoA synthetase beta subunit/citryl-CoA synthetase large subunit
MRFYEHESKALFARHGLPLGKNGLARSADDARRIAAELGGPLVLKSQVLSGGRMKAGAVKFADAPEEAGPLFDEIMGIEVRGQKPDCVLVEQKSAVAQEYYAGVTWDGRRKLPVVIFSDMGGIDIEEVAEKHPEHVSKTHVSTILPISPRLAKEAIGATGVSGGDLNRLTPIVFSLIEIFLAYDLTLAEINPLAKLEDGRFIVLDGHVDMEAEARDRHRALLDEIGIRPEETRQARPPTDFEIRGAQVDKSDHRGVAGNVVEFDGDLGLIIGAGGGSLTLFDAVRKHGGEPANYCEIGGNREDRGDDERGLEHARRHRGARRDQGLHRIGSRAEGCDRHLPHSRLLGGRGLQDPRQVRSRVLRPQRLDVRRRRSRRGEDAGGCAMSRGRTGTN